MALSIWFRLSGSLEEQVIVPHFIIVDLWTVLWKALECGARLGDIMNIAPVHHLLNSHCKEMSSMNSLKVLQTNLLTLTRLGASYRQSDHLSIILHLRALASLLWSTTLDCHLY